MGFFDQMKQLMEVKQKMEEVKKRLDTITVTSENDYVRVTANGNRKVKDITILRHDDLVTLEGKLQSAVNEAMEKSDQIMQSEMMAVTKDMVPPNLPGM